MKEFKNKKICVYLDMDGTLTEWRNIKLTSSENVNADELADELMRVLLTPNYYYSLTPNEIFLLAIKELIEEYSDIEFYILSCYPGTINDSPYKEKNEWCDKYIPEIPAYRRIFIPYGKDKSDYISNGVKEDDYLIDDKTSNLVEFERAGGNGIKVLNGCNHSNGSWKGNRISIFESKEEIKKALLNIIKEKELVMHDKPKQIHNDFSYEDFCR